MFGFPIPCALVRLPQSLLVLTPFVYPFTKYIPPQTSLPKNS